VWLSRKNFFETYRPVPHRRGGPGLHPSTGAIYWVVDSKRLERETGWKSIKKTQTPVRKGVPLDLNAPKREVSIDL